MITTENMNFPRGGRKPQIVEVPKRKREENLFHVEAKSRPKRVKHDHHESTVSERNEDWQLSLKLQGTLTYAKMEEGMIVLSCVRHITNLTFQVEFPGLTHGIATINQISDDFNKVLTNILKSGKGSYDVSLRKIISVGQLMPVKILSVEKTEKGHAVQASTNPGEINANKQHYSFKKGETIWANAVSELDHGYELTVGVKNCRVFLPFKNVPDGKKYEIGEPFYCVVHKVAASSSATVLTVGTKIENTHRYQMHELTLSDTIPGSCVKFTIEEISTHGVKGRFLNNCFGYIDQTQLSPEVNLAKLTEGSVLTAYVLFIEPITKVTYLTMRGLDKLQGPQLEIGKIITANVISSAPGGLYLQLGKTAIGFVTNKRLVNTVPQDGNVDVFQAVKNKFPVGSRHDCRILDYNYMQQLYICTCEKQILKEKVFTMKDLEMGLILKVTVEKILSSGLVVKSGHVRGFVPNMHLSNSEYNKTVKTKFSPGMKVEARVLKMPQGKNPVFTLKQDLIKCRTCLSNKDEAEINSNYVGVVIQTSISGARIEFFGDVKGWLSNKTLNVGNRGQLMNPQKYFFIGQAVTVWVLDIKEKEVRLSLQPPQILYQTRMGVGESFGGIISEVNSNGIKINTSQKWVEAFIPVAHLCHNFELSQIVLKMYRPGDRIKSLISIKSTDTEVVASRRESVAFHNKSLKVYKLNDLKKNMDLRCYLEEETEDGIFVSSPIKDYSQNIFIPKENYTTKKGVQLTFEKHKTILCKILNVNYRDRDLTLSVIFEKPSHNSEDTFDQLLQDVEFATTVFTRNNNDYTKWKVGKVGTHMTCTIENINENGDHIVTLRKGGKGVIRSHLTQPGSKVGQQLNAVLIDFNLSEQCVELCSKRNLIQKINQVQDGSVNKSFGSSCTANFLLVTQFYMIGVLLDKDCNKQFVYLPLELNKKPKSHSKKMKIVICRKVGNKIVGVLGKAVATKIPKIPPKLEQPKPEEAIESSSEDEDTVESAEPSDEDVPESGQESDEDVESIEVSDEEATPTKSPSSPVNEPNSTENLESVLPGAQSFYISRDEASIEDDSSSSDDEEEETMHPKKRLKLTPQERAEAAKKEEARISQIEKQLADIPTIPQTAEQFDRQLLANPNSSELWLQYMAMHVAAAELDKARAVGKRAIETVNMTLVKEKFNIWVALLNLENMYGTKESFETVFEDAVRYDSLEIYLSVINLFATSGKLVEMEEKIRKLRAKEKHNSKMWLEVGRIYYSLQMFKEARNIKEAAIKSILDKKRQFDLILRFGIMEFQLGDLEQAIAYFETILNAYPSKVNIWSIYVDQLVKRKNIDCARKILERAVGQKFGAKTMKILFQKYINFERQHGTEESVEKVKELAKAYVTNL